MKSWIKTCRVWHIVPLNTYTTNKNTGQDESWVTCVLPSPNNRWPLRAAPGLMLRSSSKVWLDSAAKQPQDELRGFVCVYAHGSKGPSRNWIRIWSSFRIDRCPRFSQAGRHVLSDSWLALIVLPSILLLQLIKFKFEGYLWLQSLEELSIEDWLALDEIARIKIEPIACA